MYIHTHTHTQAHRVVTDTPLDGWSTVDHWLMIMFDVMLLKRNFMFVFMKTTREREKNERKIMMEFKPVAMQMMMAYHTMLSSIVSKDWMCVFVMLSFFLDLILQQSSDSFSAILPKKESEIVSYFRLLIGRKFIWIIVRYCYWNQAFAFDIFEKRHFHFHLNLNVWIFSE